MMNNLEDLKYLIHPNYLKEYMEFLIFEFVQLMDYVK